METVKLGAKPIRLEDVRAVAVKGARVALAPSAKRKLRESQQFLASEIRKGKTMYGVNTGFGVLANVRIDDSQIGALQVNLIRSHAVGIGAPLSDDKVRAMLLLRAQALAQGNSGVSVELVEQIIALLNKNICPIIPEQGSVGASGDLAPLAHLALGLIGEGRVRMNGREMKASAALQAARLKPIELGPKEGLALINGTQFMTAIGALTLLDAEHLCDVADLAGAISLEAIRGTSTAFEPEIHSVRPHPGQIEVARRMRALLTPGGRKSAIARSHEGCGKVQDSYSLRCIPQVHGASRDTLRFVREVLEREINSVTDNPLVFASKRKILSGGNFHGQIVAIAMDTLAIAVAELASISEERFARLINPITSDQPIFLVKDGGLNSGFMIVHVAAASIVSENKTLCHPASVDSIPTNVEKEDHVSMGAWGARKAAQVVVNSRRVIAMEMLAGAQGISLLRPLKASPAVERAHKIIRKVSAPLVNDRSLHEEMAAVERLIADRQFEAVVEV